MQFKLIEPLRELFQDEVRRLGEILGLPTEIVWRQPFPGPGLAIRVLGEVTPERLAVLRDADAIVQTRCAPPASKREVCRPSPSSCRSGRSGVMGDFARTRT